MELGSVPLAPAGSRDVLVGCEPQWRALPDATVSRPDAGKTWVAREEGPDVKKLVPRNDLAQSWPEKVHDSLRSRVWLQDQRENERRRPTHSGYVTEHEMGFGQSPESAQGRPKRVNSVGAYRRVRLRNHEVCGEADVEILPRHAPPGRE
jgi:hypothetical protein